METQGIQKKSRGLYWLLFFASIAAFILLMIYKREMTPLCLPFIVTFFSKALNIM